MVLVLIVLVLWATPPTSPTATTTTTEIKYVTSHHPFFEREIETNQSSQVGSTVFLPCRVKNLGNKSVTWLRSRDAHILTVDRFTFISDERFTLLHPNPNTFTLAIRHAQPRDTGQYECQITTSPKSSLVFSLNVIVPQTRILGETDVFVQSGSSLTIKCVIYDALEEPEYVFWFLDGARLISFPSSPSTTTFSSQSVERLSPDTTLASLTINDVGKLDAGNYSCLPRNLDAASVLVHVLANETPAAMQQQNKDTTNPIINSSTRITMINLLLIINLLF